MPIPIKYSLKNVIIRSRTVVFTIIGIALVGFVFTAVQMLTEGIRTTLVGTGSEKNAIVIQKASLAETTSGVDREQANILRTLAGIEKDAKGDPLCMAEGVVLVTLPKKGTSTKVNVTLRGTSEKVLEIRDHIKLAEGRMFTPGTTEIVIGSGVRRLFENMEIGGSINFFQRKWTVVGIIDAGRSGFDSEIWCDVVQAQQAVRRDGFSSFTARISDASAFDAFKAAVDADNRLKLEVKREKKFYADQSENLATFVGILGSMVSFIFSIGAIVGAMITMYAAVANRTREIGTLQAIGFKRWEIVIGFLLEAETIALLGGFVGLIIASVLTTVSFSTTNFDSFNETEFKFSLSSSVIIKSLIFSLVMGFLGGVLPAIHASRMKVVDALRSV
ncbi:MAG: FtsX-like permease family protein [Chloroherpetonaceae bacterium]|nr:FtsX-like permease family protein [Chloroherpetonaceae bacterium]